MAALKGGLLLMSEVPLYHRLHVLISQTISLVAAPASF